jgi:hypothetical protein
VCPARMGDAMHGRGEASHAALDRIWEGLCAHAPVSLFA